MESEKWCDFNAKQMSLPVYHRYSSTTCGGSGPDECCRCGDCFANYCRCINGLLNHYLLILNDLRRWLHQVHFLYYTLAVSVQVRAHNLLACGQCGELITKTLGVNWSYSKQATDHETCQHCCCDVPSFHIATSWEDRVRVLVRLSHRV
jgi:hypothetical protein